MELQNLPIAVEQFSELLHGGAGNVLMSKGFFVSEKRLQAQKDVFEQMLKSQENIKLAEIESDRAKELAKIEAIKAERLEEKKMRANCAMAQKKLIQDAYLLIGDLAEKGQLTDNSIVQILSAANAANYSHDE